MRKFVLLIFFLLNFVKFFFVEFCYFSQNEFSKDKGRQDYDNEKQRFDRIEFFLQLENQKPDSDRLNPNKIKDEIIKIFKDEKMDVTNILQKELKEQVMILNKEMVISLFVYLFIFLFNFLFF